MSDDNKIAPAQVERMLLRYATTIDTHYRVMGDTFGSRELELARGAVDAALARLAVPARHDEAGARHLMGFVQGVLLCKGLHTWEYLATDDRRE